MNTDTLKPLLDDIAKDEIHAIVKAEVAAQMSKYNLESLARLVMFALSYSKQDHKNTVDVEKTLEHFLKLVG